MKKEHFNSGKNNGMWKGSKAGYGAIHDFVRSRKKKPKWCQYCKKRPALDLSNKSGKYKRNLNDWDYLCRKCHMDKDGRNEQLRQSGKSRKLSNKICKNEKCNKSFHRDDRKAKFCSEECFYDSRRGVSRPFYNNQYTKKI